MKWSVVSQKPLPSQSILNKGLILYNQEKLSHAESVLKNLVRRFTKDAVAQQALGTLKEIAVDTDKVLSLPNGSNHRISIPSLIMNWANCFLAAEKQFLSDRKKQAKNLLFPIWIFILRGAMPSVPILYWRNLFEESDDESALEHYQKLIDDNPMSIMNKPWSGHTDLGKTEMQ